VTKSLKVWSDAQKLIEPDELKHLKIIKDMKHHLAEPFLTTVDQLKFVEALELKHKSSKCLMDHGHCLFKIPIGLKQVICLSLVKSFLSVNYLKQLNVTKSIARSKSWWLNVTEPTSISSESWRCSGWLAVTNK
jgi:hypothetical protein